MALITFELKNGGFGAGSNSLITKIKHVYEISLDIYIYICIYVCV